MRRRRSGSVARGPAPALKLGVLIGAMIWATAAAFDQVLLASHDPLISATVLLLLAALLGSLLLPRRSTGRP